MLKSLIQKRSRRRCNSRLWFSDPCLCVSTSPTPSWHNNVATVHLHNSWIVLQSGVAFSQMKWIIQNALGFISYKHKKCPSIWSTHQNVIMQQSQLTIAFHNRISWIRVSVHNGHVSHVAAEGKNKCLYNKLSNIFSTQLFETESESQRKIADWNNKNSLVR